MNMKANDERTQRLVAAALHAIELDEAERDPHRWDYLSDPDELVRSRGALSGLRVA